MLSPGVLASAAAAVAVAVGGGFALGRAGGASAADPSPVLQRLPRPADRPSLTGLAPMPGLPQLEARARTSSKRAAVTPRRRPADPVVTPQVTPQPQPRPKPQPKSATGGDPIGGGTT